MKSDYAYIGKAACGCVRAAVTEDCRDAAEAVAKMIRDGLRVERVTNAAVRADPTWKGCSQCREPVQKSLI